MTEITNTDNVVPLSEETVVSLSETSDDLSDDIVKTVADEIALGELHMRKEAAKKVIDLFKTANLFVLGFLLALFIMDWIAILFFENIEEPRLIDKDVVMALIGATTIQLGAIMLSIAKFLFPKPKES